MYAVKVIDTDQLEEMWIVSYDPDTHDPNRDYPTGMLVTSDDRTRAKLFPSFQAAYEFITQQSTVMPLRPTDGKPNRPLTALSVEITQVADNDV